MNPTPIGRIFEPLPGEVVPSVRGLDFSLLEGVDLQGDNLKAGQVAMNLTHDP